MKELAPNRHRSVEGDGTGTNSGDKCTGGKWAVAKVNPQAGENEREGRGCVDGLAPPAFEYPLAIDRRSGEH